MAKSYTANYRERTGSTSGEDALYLLEISHAQLVTPIRVVNDTADIVSNGNTYIAYPFRITLPDDVAGQMPRATLTIDNLGRELTQWLDDSAGGREATVRVMQIMRDAPDVIEYEITVDLRGVGQDVGQVSGQLGYEDVLNLPGLPMTYRADLAPGLF